jgi:ribonuclease P protein component
VKKIYSLKGKKSFNEVFNKGKRYRGTGIQVIIVNNINSSGNPHTSNNKDVTHLKFGIVMSRHFGKAFARNKARRRIRSILQKFLPDICDNLKVVIRLFDDFKKLGYLDLQNEILHVFKKAKILKSK